MKCLILDIEELISSKVSKVKYSDGTVITARLDWRFLKDMLSPNM